MIARTFLPFAAAALLLVGCEDALPLYQTVGDGPDRDSGTDAGPNADAEAGPDADAEAGPDAEAGVDADADADADAETDGSTDADADADDADSGMQPAGAVIAGAPLLFAPTPTSFGISVILASGDPAALRARVRKVDGAIYDERVAPVVRASDLAEWSITGLQPGTRYDYEILDDPLEAERSLYQGKCLTTRTGNEPFSFALLSDSHIGPHLDYYNQGDEEVLSSVSQAIHASNPDFIVNLGDMLDFHEYGFNAPPPDGSITRLAYLNYRGALGDSTAFAPHFPVIGNWEGENGDYTAEQINWSMQQRLLYMPSPAPETYPEGGATTQDYYAYTWGDALFVVLNVMTYTTTSHTLSPTDSPDDWTLGSEQLEFLRSTLENATSRWRFLMIHHAVGGAAGNPANSGYGRGGGQAANVGEQAIVHQLMIDHGVQIFFYGHDHVFTDMVVDGIRYTAPGSAGAPWMFTPAETGYEQSWLESGWGRVDVSPERVHVEFLGLDGHVIYEYDVE